MTILVFSFLLLGTSFLAGLVGSLTGLGGGVVMIPVLVLLFHVNIHYAMGASLISVIATSSGAAAAYLREGYTNLRIGMFLETGAVIGAFIGAILVAYLSKTFIAILFSLVLFVSAFLTIRRKEEIDLDLSPHPWAVRLRLSGRYQTAQGEHTYSVQSVPAALSIMGIAGCLSGLLGIGSGALKVLAMDHAMRLPYKVATSTSNFIIGITAAVSVGVYFSHGYIDPGITFPVMIGVPLGAFLGAKILVKVGSQRLRVFFSAVICLLGLEMLYKAMTGAI
ncbi:MAG: sulfite exporter TauE/SafE family protein [Gammaproteobacteria bacterium]